MFAALVLIGALGAFSLAGAIATLRVTGRDGYRPVPSRAAGRDVTRADPDIRGRYAGPR